jgi:nitroreductase
MQDILSVIQERQSARGLYDPEHRVARQDLGKILEAARWAPTAHNMQNFEIVVVDDKRLIEDIGNITYALSTTFIRENYQQLSFSEEELVRKKVGLSASHFPPALTLKEEVDQPPIYLAEAPRLIVTYYAAGPPSVLPRHRSVRSRRGVVPQDSFLKESAERFPCDSKIQMAMINTRGRRSKGKRERKSSLSPFMFVLPLRASMSRVVLRVDVFNTKRPNRCHLRDVVG